MLAQGQHLPTKVGSRRVIIFQQNNTRLGDRETFASRRVGGRPRRGNPGTTVVLRRIFRRRSLTTGGGGWLESCERPVRTGYSDAQRILPRNREGKE